MKTTRSPTKKRKPLPQKTKKKAFDIHSYDKYIVSFSGGKDSTACFLFLLEMGIPKSKIELWHQDIDGREKTFFDWEITADYCRKFAKAFGVPIYFQWKEGGFYKEMHRKNSYTSHNCFELPDGTIQKAGGKTGKKTTRYKFPQCSMDLLVRWCSGYLKIDVFKMALVNQERFRGIRTLVLSGERGEESPKRAKYKVLEKDSADLRDGKKYQRYVDRYRPLRDWKEETIWLLLEKYRVRAHPCYYMGWGRCSCKFCIFGNSNQFASAAHISPILFNDVTVCEDNFKYTLKRDTDLRTFTKAGTVYPAITQKLKKLVTSYNYNQPIIIPFGQPWILPAGAFGENCGAA